MTTRFTATTLRESEVGRRGGASMHERELGQIYLMLDRIYRCLELIDQPSFTFICLNANTHSPLFHPRSSPLYATRTIQRLDPFHLSTNKGYRGFINHHSHSFHLIILDTPRLSFSNDQPLFRSTSTVIFTKEGIKRVSSSTFLST